MMKKIMLIIFVLLVAIPTFAKPYHQWVDAKSGAGNSRNNNIVADSSGNVWVSGSFSGKIVLDGQEYQADGEQDAYFQKISPKGEILFTRVLSGYSDDTITSMCCDAENIYVLGYCSEGVMLNGQTATEMPDIVSYSGFVAKYSLKGELLWVKFIRSSISGFNKIRINKEDLIIGMTFLKQFFYDDELYQFTSESMFFFGVMMIDPVNGAPRLIPNTEKKEIYAYNIGYTTTVLSDFAIYNKNLYIVANKFLNPEDEDQSQMVIFKAVLSTNTPNSIEELYGKYIEDSNNSLDKVLNIEINSLGEVIVSGYYYDDLIFVDTDAPTVDIVAAEDAKIFAGFVLGLTPDLTIKWKHILDNDYVDQIRSIHINGKNEIFLTGMISSDSLSGFKTNGLVDLFVEKIDYQGNSEWLLNAGSKDDNIFFDSDNGFGIVTTSNGTNESIYTVGAYDGTGVFGTDTIAKTDENRHAATWKIKDSPNYFLLKAGDISADYSDTCYVPISYTGNINLSQGSTTTMKIELVFNSTLLYPLMDFGEQDVEMDTMFLDDLKQRHVQYTIVVNEYEQNILAELPFVVGWGNAVNTPIELNVLDLQTEVFIGFDGTEDGLFTLTGIEYIDGEPILIEPQGNMIEMQIMPNPIAEAGNIDVAITENSHIDIYIADMQGKNLMSIDKGDMLMGKYSYTLNVSQLAIGSYLLVAEVNGKILSAERFEIMR